MKTSMNMKAIGIHDHPLFKLGAAKSTPDKRDLQFKEIRRAAMISVPDEYDYDLDHPGIPTPMFGNDVYGCCVISARAHQTLRFENWEQKGAILPITAKIVLNEYFRQTGGRDHDDGLVIADSLSLWRKIGWAIPTVINEVKKRKRYYIDLYAAVNWENRLEVKQATIVNRGINMGFGLPMTAQAQTQMGQPWDYVGGSGSAPYSWGGHDIVSEAYNAIGPIVISWGRKIQTTWAFVSHYCDECKLIIDRLNRFRKKNSPINAGLGSEFLEGVSPVAA